MTLFILLVACVQSDLDSGVGSLDCSQDCARPECVDDAACEEIPPPDEDCADGIDNDGDGAVDCADADCEAACVEDCWDGVDNDKDGLTDCEDTDCSWHCDEDCGDGVDNDADGQVDCLDWECSGKTAPCIEVCDDGLDNDEDGTVDCLDADCQGLVAPCIEVCADGLDNDADGLMDCEDADCQFECTELSCTDGLDNNGNGRVDCADEACWGLEGCPVAIGIRVLSGKVRQSHNAVRTSASEGGLEGSSDAVTLRSAEGTLHVGLESASLSCLWTADRVYMDGGFYHWSTSGYSGGASASHALRVSGFSSTGACAGYYDPKALGFQSEWTESTSPSRSFDHTMRFLQAQVLLDGALWLAGPGTSYQFTAWHSSDRALSFEIDPVHTEPWIFGP